MNITEVKIMGDSGEEHTITVDSVTKAARCSCKSFRYNAIAVCKHIAFLAESLNVGETAETPVAPWGNAAQAPIPARSSDPYPPYESVPYRPYTSTPPIGFNAANWE